MFNPYCGMALCNDNDDMARAINTTTARTTAVVPLVCVCEYG